MRRLALLAALVLVVLLIFHTASSLTVHLVPHSHDDVGWQVTVDQYYIGAVQYIITTVVEQLQLNPDRKFIYVEQAYFQRWWREQTDQVKDQVRQLVQNKQLEFINGGWCMHDEAGTHYVDMIDQTTYGHRFIKEQFGVAPKVGWQIDPFGHSATQAALLSGEVGFEALFFGRIDYQDYNIRAQDKRLEWVWRASPSLGPESEVFAGQFWNGYGAPGGFDFDIGSGDPPVQDDMRLTDYNVEQRVEDFVRAAQDQSRQFQGENLMWTMGSDFEYTAAHTWFTNLDKLIRAVNADGRVHAQYSTPSLYVEAKNRENLTFTVKTDDIFPYADCDSCYWTGYFTSRPALKRYTRVQSAFLQVARHLEMFTGGNGTANEPLWEALGVVQHHDGVSGTAKQAVTFDYAKRLAVGGASSDAVIQAALGTLLTKQGGMPPAFSYCPDANTSICAGTATNPNVVVALYNPMARKRTELVRVPISAATATVSDGSGMAIPSQVVTLPTDNPARTGDSQPYEVRFQATVAGLGINTYFVQTKTAQPQPAPATQDSHYARHISSLPSVAAAAPPAAPSISNQYWRVDFDTNGLVSAVTDLETQVTTPFSQNFLWYHSYQKDGDQNSGAYIFRPQDPQDPGTPVATSATLTIVTGTVTNEAQQTFAPWLTQVVRLVNGSRAIEFEYTVGPIPIDDKQGKEIIARYISPIGSNGTWWTDSNGREWQKRIRNFRPAWPWNPTQPVAGNYYPVNAATWLADNTTGFSIVNDRSQGGSSLQDGALELMVHRRLTMDDGRGVGEPLSEPGLDGKGLIITGTHYIQLTAVADLAMRTRSQQQRTFAPLHWSIAPLSGSISDYLSSHNSQWSALQTELRVSVELMSCYAQADGTVLLRLAHNFGVDDGSDLAQPVTVDLSKLFVNEFTPTGVTEVTLTANQKPQDVQRLHWNTNEQAGRQKHWTYRQPNTDDPMTVVVKAAEVRTFVLSF